MTPTPEELKAPRSFGWVYINEGAFAEVFVKEFAAVNTFDIRAIGPGIVPDMTLTMRRERKVLKIAKCSDGTMDYIEWCYLRMRKFGKGSPEMNGLPEVEAFGRCGDAFTSAEEVFSGTDGPPTQGWWCVMPEYGGARHLARSVLQESCSELIDMLNTLFGRGFCNDTHQGNFMIDESRGGMVVLTDPSCRPSIVDRGYPLPPSERFVVSTELRQPKTLREAAKLEGCGCPMCRAGRGPALQNLPRVDAAEERAMMKMIDFGGRWAAPRFKPFKFDRPFADIGKDALDKLAKYFAADLVLAGKQADLLIADDIQPAKIPVINPIGPGRKRNRADWKVPQLQRQQHMR